MLFTVNLLSLWLSVIWNGSVVSAEGGYTAQVNDDGALDFRCPDNKTIRVQDTYYVGETDSDGDSNDSDQPNLSTRSNRCDASKFDNVVNECSGRNFCEITREVIGTSCEDSMVDFSCEEDIKEPCLPCENGGTCIGSNRGICTNPPGQTQQPPSTMVELIATTSENVAATTQEPSSTMTDLIATASEKDVEPPTSTCPTIITRFVPSEQEKVIVLWPDSPLFTDNSDVPLKVNCSSDNGTELGIGQISVYCTAVDDSGNNNSCSFQINVTRGFCDEEAGRSGTWPQTMARGVAESEERCPVDTTGRNMGRYSRNCKHFNATVGGVWEEEYENICGEFESVGLVDLFNITLTDDNVDDVTDALTNVIEDSIQKDEDIDIADIQQAFTNIVEYGSSSPNVTEGVVNTLHTILSTNISSDDEGSAMASSQILKSVEQQVIYTIEEHGTFNSLKPTVAVAGVAVSQAEFTGGIGFGISQTDTEIERGGTYDPDTMQTGRPDVGSAIQLPNDALFENGIGDGAKVSFIAYNDNQLFKSELLDELNDTRVVGPILSAVVLDKNVTNLEKPVVIHIELVKDEVKSAGVFNNTRCVYWDFSKRDGIGDWAEDGCELISAELGKITCQCNHLTNFAVLVDFSGQHGSEPGALTFVLDIISKVGCAFSIVGLCLTLLIFLCCRGLRISLQRKILIQFCFSMLFLYLVFLIGIDRIHSKAGCFITAALLHYFVVTSVLWMGVEARHMYITLVSESARVSRKFMIRAGLFVWGVGLIPVGVVLAVEQHKYLAPSYCFLAPDLGLFLGLLLPIGLVLLHNTITFALVARKLLRSRSYVLKSDLENHGEGEADDGEEHKTEASEVSQRLLNAFAVSILLGVTWVFGFLAIEEARFAFQLLFCIFNSFQGVLIFILFCYAQKDVRKLIFTACFSEPPSQPAVKQVKKPGATGATSVSSDTRLTGESYTEDNDTLVTSVNGMTMTMMDSEDVDSQDDQEKPNGDVNKTEAADAEKPATADEKEEATPKDVKPEEADAPGKSEPMIANEKQDSNKDPVAANKTQENNKEPAVASKKQDGQKETVVASKKQASNKEPVTEETVVNMKSETEADE